MPSDTATIDRFGRVVIPKAMRDAAGLVPGTRLRLMQEDGRISMEPEPVPVRLERRGRLLCAVPEAELPTLTVDDVNALLDTLRNRG